MRVITKQLTKEILLSTAFVLVALVALFAFFDLIGQLDDVGSGRTMQQAFTLTALTLPSRIYEVMPLAALLASVFVMSRWAANSEFTVLRVAGLSPVSLATSLLLPGLILVALTYFFGEFAAPPAERYAQEVKSAARHTENLTARGYSSGVWVRDVTKNEAGEDVDRYINVKYLKASNQGETGGWRLFEFDPKGHLKVLIESKSASYVPGEGWTLHKVERYVYPQLDRTDNRPTSEGVKLEKLNKYLLHSSLGPDILGVMTTKPDTMSMRDLDRYVTHLKKNNQQTEHYEVAFWNKAFYPLATLVMIALSMPFAYMNARSGGVAIKIFLGVMIGIVFYAMNNLFSYLGVLNTWSPIVVCLVPSGSMMIIAALAMYWVERR